jgi:hypothetical protein
MKKPQESRSFFVKTHHCPSQLLKFKVIQIMSGHLHTYLGLPDPEDKGTMNLQDIRNNMPNNKV